MRPTRLEIEGFASFRARTVVEFDDADLFVLFGPTGAGKSSLIDAIVFALYGSVPRYADKRLVAPVVSQGLNEARVRLDFRAGAANYTAVRVVQRTKTGATTKEARLESGETTLAGTADELTNEVTRLLGLSFEHFTRCVVLPQGAFAEFMHARAAERQDLLVRLLGLDLYERVREAATQQAREKEARTAQLEERLEGELAGATAEAAEAAEARVETLETLVASIEAARPELEALSTRHRESGLAAQESDTRAKLLGAVAVPADLEALVRRIGDAAGAAERAQAELDRAVRQREEAEAARAALPERAVLDAAARTHTELSQAEARLAKADAEAATAEEAAKAAAGVRAEAESGAHAAEEALQTLQRERAAAHLAQHITVGEPCPVCHQTIATLPEHPVLPEQTEARQRRADAHAELDRARAAAEKAASSLAARQADVANARTRRDQLTREVATLPAPDALETLRARIDAAETSLADARRTETDARRDLRAARAAAATLDAERARAWQAFDDMRDRLSAAALAPPPAAREDLPGDWGALVAWARDRIPHERAAADAHREAARSAREGFTERIEKQRARCAELGVVTAAGDPRDACTDALAEARQTARRLCADVERAVEMRAELAVVGREARTAKDLSRHLDARNFERWLMTRALRRLVAGATQVLRDLSGGTYSLDLDTRNDFVVIDHRNADERRMARTLSGGETFLASLSLALALAEHVAEIATGGSAKLDALFLDEGFGTLDTETLDIVATAIEELGSRGRMVGLVTHVRDLAERVPVRFDVRKVGAGSEVTRVG